MNQIEKKDFVLDYIKMVEEFMENNLKTMEMFVELDAFEVLESFLNYYFSENAVMTMVFLSPAIKKLEEN